MPVEQEGANRFGRRATLDYAGGLPARAAPSPDVPPVTGLARAALAMALFGPVMFGLLLLTPVPYYLDVKRLGISVIFANVALPIATIVRVALSGGSRRGIGMAVLSLLVFAAECGVGVVIAFFSFHGC